MRFHVLRGEDVDSGLVVGNAVEHVGKHKHIAKTCFLHLSSEDGGSTSLRNVDILQHDHTALQLRKSTSTYSVLILDYVRH
jgi:hypothetical protein